jgi:hypothetical protein
MADEAAADEPNQQEECTNSFFFNQAAWAEFTANGLESTQYLIGLSNKDILSSSCRCLFSVDGI